MIGILQSSPLSADRIPADLLKQLCMFFLFRLQAYKIVIRAAFRIGKPDIDPSRNRQTAFDEIIGGEHGILGIGANFRVGRFLNLQKKSAVWRLIPVHF